MWQHPENSLLLRRQLAVAITEFPFTNADEIVLVLVLVDSSSDL
jgi:hypothetical protein